MCKNVIQRSKYVVKGIALLSSNRDTVEFSNMDGDESYKIFHEMLHLYVRCIYCMYPGA